jgi:transcriptional regulator with XRE-family HTH domain
MTKTLGSRIREARDRYGMSQAELARRIGISNTALNQIESGKTQNPGVAYIVAIARVLGVSTDSLLLGGAEEQPPRPRPQPKRQRPRKAAPVG